jgi:nucleoside-diphosphate-sugar epimerase
VDILAAFRLAARGLALRIPAPGQRLSMIHVHDLATAFAAAAESDRRGVFYVSDGAVHTWESIMERIAAAVGRRVRVIPLPRVVAALAAHADRTVASLTRKKPLLTPDRLLELLQPEWTCDDSRARRELGFVASTDLPTGLRQTAAWYRDQRWL